MPGLAVELNAVGELEAIFGFVRHVYSMVEVAILGAFWRV